MAATSEQPPADDVQPPSNKAKILVIDDELGPRESLRFLLKGECEVQVADTVAGGLDLLRSYHPDVIVMDIRMPGMNGIEGLREIRKFDQDVAIIMLTGYGALETAQEAIRHGANEYMKKPFDAAEMREAIRRNIERAGLNRKRSSMTRELAGLNQRLSDELQLKERMASLGLASAELVHDLRNPLQIASGFVELLGDQLARQAASGERQEYLDSIQKSIVRCKDLVESWLSISRHEKKGYTRINLRDIAAGTAGEMTPLASAKKAHIHFDSASSSATILGNAGQISRVVQNLVANAIDSLAVGAGRVEINVRSHEEKAFMEIRDNGCGIADEQLQHMFEPFNTSKHDSTSTGTGLGLFISRHIIEDHGGTITIASQFGKGTTVTVCLPLAAGVPSAAA